MLQGLERALGMAVVLVVLLDVFLTVLYARLGTGLISGRLSQLVWRLFHVASTPFGHRRRQVLTFCGPSILVLLVGTWALGLTLGTALIIHPELGSSITARSGETPTDFVTAMYVGGSSIAVVGASDFVPRTGTARMFFLLASIVGLSVTSLTLSYLLQVYTALQQRNALGLELHLLAAETADAAELLAGLGPEGEFQGGYTILASLGTGMARAKEAHHFYPVLFYFRFDEPLYAVSRFTLLALDAVSLLKSGLDDRQHAWLKESAPVVQLWRAALILVISLENTFLPGGAPREGGRPGQDVQDRWRRRYAAGLRRFRQAGIATVEDERAGAESYVELRASWDRHVATLAPSMAYEPEEIDPAGSRPEAADERPAFRARQHSTG